MCNQLNGSSLSSPNDSETRPELSAGVLKAGDYGTMAICLVSMVFGVTGSLYVSVRIIREPRLKSFRYFFVANQCVVDFCTTFFLAGSRMLHYYDLVSVASRCTILYTMYAIAEYVSPMILLLLAIERFIITVYPLHKDRFLLKRNYLGVVVFLWVSTALLSLGFIMGSETCQNGEKYYCHLQLWKIDEDMTEIILCVVCFVFPFSAMLILYAAIAVKAVLEIREVDQFTHESNHMSPCNDGNRKVYKLAKTFFIVSITVAVIRLPKNVIQMMVVSNELFEEDPSPFNKGAAYYLFWNWGVLMPYLASAVTPWVYIIMSPFMNKPLRDQRENIRKISTMLTRNTAKTSKCKPELLDGLNVNDTPKHLLVNTHKRSDAEETNF